MTVATFSSVSSAQELILDHTVLYKTNCLTGLRKIYKKLIGTFTTPLPELSKF